MMGLFLLHRGFENANAFSLQNLDRERLVWLVTVNETVEREEFVDDWTRRLFIRFR